MDDPRTPGTGQLAVAIGVTAVGAAVSLATYFAVGGPFGTINDIGNAAIGVLSGGLAWRLRRQLVGGTARLGTMAAIVGAVLTVVGAALVVSRTTGFLFAGLVSGVGFAGIGAWLIVLNRSLRAGAWPWRLRVLGLGAGGLMALGIVLLPGIPLRIDDMATAPAWIWVGLMSWLGIYVVYPAWAIRMGMIERRRTRAASVAVAGAGAFE